MLTSFPNGNISLCYVFIVKSIHVLRLRAGKSYAHDLISFISVSEADSIRVWVAQTPIMDRKNDECES